MVQVSCGLMSQGSPEDKQAYGSCVKIIPQTTYNHCDVVRRDLVGFRMVVSTESV